MRWGFGDGGLSAGREREGDEDVVEGEGGIRELVFEGDGGGAGVDGGPAVDWEKRRGSARSVGGKGVNELTRDGNHTFVRARQPPLKNTQTLSHREPLLALFQPNLSLRGPSVLVDVGVSLELQVVALGIARWRGEVDHESGVGGVGDAKVEISLEREGRDAAVAVEGEGEVLADDEVDTASGRGND